MKSAYAVAAKGAVRPGGRILALTLACLGAILPVARPADVTEERDADAVSEVIIRSGRVTEPSTISLPAGDLATVAGALGDPVRGVFSLPGVVFAGGDTGVPAVRGSGPADNLYLVEGLPVPYVFHTLELGSSVFSDLTVETFDLRLAGFGPAYTNVTGAVFDIGLRDPRRQPLLGTVDVSMLRSGVFLESGLGENSAAYLSFRKGMLEHFIDAEEETDGVRLTRPPRDSDYQGRYVLQLGERSKLTADINGASDAAKASFSQRSQLAGRQPDFGGDAQVDSRYDRQSLIWDHAGASGTRFRVAAGRSRQTDRLRYGLGYFNFETRDRDVARLQLDTPLSRTHTLHVTGQWQQDRLGVELREVLFVCNEFDPTCADERRGEVTGRPVLRDRQYSLGVSDAWQIGPRWRVDTGALLRRSSFTGETLLEPRGSIQWQAAARTSLSLNLGRYSQFPDAAAVLPGLGNPDLDSPQATHVALGLRQDWENGWSLTAEPYFKRLTGLPLALGPEAVDADRRYANDVRGTARGLDVLLRAPSDARLSGWVALSLSRSERTDQRTGVTTKFYLDTPLLANAVLTWRWSEKIELGGRLTLRSGQPDTPIVAAAANPLSPTRATAVYGEPFSDRLPTYVRADLRLSRQFTLRGRPSSFSLDLINVTGSRNVTARSLDYTRTVPGGPLFFETEEGLGFFPAISLRTTFW